MEENEVQLSRYFESPEQNEPDAETVRRAIDGDKEAFEVLFQNTYRRMFFVTRRILSRDEDIYDALQIAYSKAYKYIGRVSPPENFYPWLAKIVENCAKDVWRETHPTEGMTSDIDACPAPDIAEDTDRRVMLGRVLKEMDPRRAEVLALYYYDGLKLAEISKLLGEPLSTIHSRLKAAKRELTDLLAQRGIDRSFYSGGFFSAIAVSLRSVMGTDILSAAVAQKMMDEVLTGKPGRLDMAAAKLVEKQRNKAILRIAELLLLIVVIVALLTSAITSGWVFRTRKALSTPGNTTVAYGIGNGSTSGTTSGTTASGTTALPGEMIVPETTGAGETEEPADTTATDPASPTTTEGELTGAPSTTTGTASAATTKPTATTASTTQTTATTSTTATTTVAAPIVNSDGSVTTPEGFTYTVSDGEATITDFDRSIGGDLVIPSTLGGYPVVRIGRYAFEQCYGLTSITIPNSVTSIEEYAFRACTKVSAMVIPDSVTSIGKRIFEYSTGLESVTIGNGITTIPHGTFYACHKLTTIIWGDNIKTIGTSAFYNCKSLTSIAIPEGVTTIENSTFYNCKALTSVVIPDSVTTIGGRAFSNCSALTSVVIPDSVTTIGGSAFYLCTALTSVRLGSGVKAIGNYAFGSCDSLETVYYSGSQADRENIVFDDNNTALLSATWEYNVEVN